MADIEPDNKDKQHWSEVSESGSVLGMRILIWVYRILGRPAFKFCLLFPVFYFFLFRGEARRASLEYLGHLRESGGLDSSAPLLWLSFRHFLTFGDSILDKFSARMGELTVDELVFDNHEPIQKLVDEKKGAVIIGSHLGNMEVVGAFVEKRIEFPITLLVHVTHAEKYNKLLQRHSERRRMNLLPVSEISPATAMMLAERVEQGELIIITGDRASTSVKQRESHVDFLGAVAEFPQGAYIIASLLKCPVYLMFCLKFDSSYHLIFESFAEEPIRLPRGQREQALHQWVQKYADRLTHYCRQVPLQWNNFYSPWLKDKKQSVDSIEH